jgi:hypothetical protein
LALILYGVDGTGCDPVDLSGKVSGVEDFGSSLIGWDNFDTEESLVLKIGHSGKFVVTNGERGLRGVDLLDFSGLVSEDILS